MKIYGAGNFVFLGDPEKEKMLAHHCVKLYGEHNRLTSFYFRKETDNILQANKELTDENSRPAGRIKRLATGNK